MRLALVAIAVCLSLSAPAAATAKEPSKKAAKGDKKGDKKSDKKKGAKTASTADAMYQQIAGKVQPLPKPTELSLQFEVEAADAEVFTMQVTAAAAATQATQKIAWTVADWRKQLALDLKWLGHYRRLLAGEVRKAQREQFVVAERYLMGLFDSTDQFYRLARQSAEQFDNEYPADRNGETMIATPDAPRRVRLYRDRAQTLFGNAQSFLARTVKDREEKVVRIDAK